MYRNCSKGAKTPRFRRGTEPPRPIGVEVIGKKDVAFHTCRECCTPTRPCEVDGKPARFHCWVEVERAKLAIDRLVRRDEIPAIRRDFDQDHIVPVGCHLEKLRDVVALVEYEGGTCAKVDPNLIQFTDREEV